LLTQQHIAFIDVFLVIYIRIYSLTGLYRLLAIYIRQSLANKMLQNVNKMFYLGNSESWFLAQAFTPLWGRWTKIWVYVPVPPCDDYRQNTAHIDDITFLWDVTEMSIMSEVW